MPSELKVIACADRSRYAEFVSDYAAWAALRLQARLEFLHVIDRHPELARTQDHSGAIGVDAQEHLLDRLSTEDEARSKAAREQGRVFLNLLRERAVSAGVEAPDVRLRHGNLRDTLVEQEPGVELFVLGRRGESAGATHRDVGRNVERVVRALHKPILTVNDTFRKPSRVLVAFDGGAAIRRGIESLAQSPLLKGLSVQVVMCGKERAHGPKQLEWARSTLESGGMDATASIVPGDPERAIAAIILAQKIDLLVMGAYSHSAVRNILFGSRTSELLRASPIATLLLR
jgi:nucleotide-binding universal stress UspA family protein